MQPLPEAFGLQAGIFGHGIEAGAFFYPFVGSYAAVTVQVGTQVAVPQYDGFGVAVVQLAEQRPQRAFLGLGTGIGGCAVAVQSAFVAYSYAVGIVVLNVGSFSFFGAAFLQCAVSFYVVVVPYVGPSSVLNMVLFALFVGVSLVCSRSRAMQDY